MFDYSNRFFFASVLVSIFRSRHSSNLSKNIPICTKICIQIQLFMCMSKNSSNWFQHATKTVHVFWSFNAEVSTAFRLFIHFLKIQRLIAFFPAFYRKMEAKQMFVERFVPCNSGCNCRINARTNHTNYRRLCYFGL